MRFRVPASAGSDAISMVGLNGWYSGRDQIEVAVRSPGGFQTPYQGVITSGSPGRTYLLPDGRVRIFTPGPDLSNGDHNFLVEISHLSDTRRPVTAGNWHLWLRGAAIQEGRVDGWVLDSSPRLDVVFSGGAVSDSHKIGSPGAAASAITVAAYTTKVRWTDIQGHIQEVGLDLNDISDFSSEGPLRTGGQKPDVAAPGAMIAAPLSADSLVGAHDMAAPGYRMMAGTSMATPFITGVVALLLEREPTLNPAQVKALLRTNSRVPGKSAGTFDPKWGYGLINLARIGGTFRAQAEAKAGGRIGVEPDGDWVVIGGVRLPVRRG
jgi:subtilisin family serine protease